MEEEPQTENEVEQTKEEENKSESEVEGKISSDFYKYLNLLDEWLKLD